MCGRTFESPRHAGSGRKSCARAPGSHSRWPCRHSCAHPGPSAQRNPRSPARGRTARGTMEQSWVANSRSSQQWPVRSRETSEWHCHWTVSWSCCPSTPRSHDPFPRAEAASWFPVGRAPGLRQWHPATPVCGSRPPRVCPPPTQQSSMHRLCGPPPVRTATPAPEPSAALPRAPAAAAFSGVLADPTPPTPVSEGVGGRLRARTSGCRAHLANSRDRLGVCLSREGRPGVCHEGRRTSAGPPHGRPAYRARHAPGGARDPAAQSSASLPTLRDPGVRCPRQTCGRWPPWSSARAPAAAPRGAAPTPPASCGPGPSPPQAPHVWSEHPGEPEPARCASDPRPHPGCAARSPRGPGRAAGAGPAEPGAPRPAALAGDLSAVSPGLLCPATPHPACPSARSASPPGEFAALLRAPPEAAAACARRSRASPPSLGSPAGRSGARP
mmetsp:Transcript_22477/g.77004  ORF Transcript_22477/g.77004 Transcript_22477/m.77004 type:complete len:442 (+) Transcript_22477:1141-2466(+)